jgi:hypothetical protein
MMSRNSIFLFMGLCLIAGIFIAGCTQPLTPVPTQTVTPTIQPASAGMKNPASVNCGNIGGTNEIKKNADSSEYGMCIFANGTSCEEWALFRGEGCNAGPVPAK